MIKLALTLFLFSFASLATEPSATTRRWWSYTETLANDNMQGRETGTAGYTQAENFVIAQFTKAGLVPSRNGRFQATSPAAFVKAPARRISGSPDP